MFEGNNEHRSDLYLKAQRSNLIYAWGGRTHKGAPTAEEAELPSQNAA